MRLPLLALLALVSPVAASAQSARWDPPGGTLAAGETTTLNLVFDGCDPKETPVPPAVDGLTLEFAGRSSNISWINGDFSKTVTLSFSALLSRKGGVDIPVFGVATDKGPVQVPAAHFDAGAATVGSTGQSLDKTADSRLEAVPASVWAGEVFNLNYTIEADHNYYPDFGRGVFTWNASPLAAEEWSRPEAFDLTSGGQPKTGLAYHTRALIRTPGTLQVSAISQLVNLNVGVTGFGFFQQRQYQQFSVVSNTPSIEVRPLPPAPAGFSGAVGDFKLVSKLVPDSAAVGEPVTWTLQLSGKGNWPDITGLPPRVVSKDFQVIQPKPKRTPAAGKLFDATLSEDIVLVPTKPGSYDLGPVEFVYFDPETGSYKTLEAPQASVTVTGAPQAAAGASGAGQPGPATQAGTAPKADLTVAALPAQLPRDPLPEPGAAAAPPLRTPVLLAALLSPIALLALFWGWLALGRARVTDPRRGLREAYGRMAAAIAGLRSVSANPGEADRLAELLLGWQHDAAILLKIPHAAPRSGHLAQAGEAWKVLWEEADRALYGASRTLPADWVSRAEAALRASPPPRFTRRQLFLLRNLAPFLAALGLLIAAGIAPARADDAANRPRPSGSSSYRQGDFPSAETSWRRELASSPTQPTAHYNLSLALAQQDRWDEAAAHASAAFVQDPGNEAIRWQFALACTKAGYAPAPLVGFVAPGPVQWLARLASPGTWQWVMIGSSISFAAALAFALALSYRAGPVSRRGVFSALTVAISALLLLLAATVGLRAYGGAADPGAVVVWRTGILRSIPTEADVEQKTTPLAAGVVGKVNKSFLGWVRLSFGNGETGWVRVGEAVPLWGSMLNRPQ
jgi:tetratricopeptide (TPR) repeat protein